MAENLEEINRDMNRVLENILEYYYTFINSLRDKAAHFLSFTVIIDSVLAGYVGTIFLLVQLRITAVTLVFDYILYLAIACLICAILCLLVTDILAVRSLSPRKVKLPITSNIDEMAMLHISFGSLLEWYIDYREKLIEVIKDNAHLSGTLARNVKIMGILLTFAVAFFIGFIASTLILALGNIASVGC